MWFWIQIIIIILIIACLWRVVSYYLKKYTTKCQKDWFNRWEEHNRWLRYEVRMSRCATNKEMQAAINRLNYLHSLQDSILENDLDILIPKLNFESIKPKHGKI